MYRESESGRGDSNENFKLKLDYHTPEKKLFTALESTCTPMSNLISFSFVIWIGATYASSDEKGGFPTPNTKSSKPKSFVNLFNREFKDKMTSQAISKTV